MEIDYPYRVEWDDQEGNRHEQYFTDPEEAQQEAARLDLMFDYVAIKMKGETK